MRVSFFLASLSFLVIFLSSCSSAKANENNIGFSKIHPAHPLYFLKTIRENFEMSLAQTPRVKWIRQLEFATRRLRETKSLILAKSEDLIAPTLERYSSHMSNVPDKDIQDQELAVKISDSLGIHLKTLEQIYADVSNIKAKMTIRGVLNKLISRADISSNAKVPICNLFAKEASSSALNEVERIVLLERAQNCIKSLTGSSF